MARVIPVHEVRYTPAGAVFEGHGDAPVTFYVTEFKRGEGTEGNFVLVPAETPHRYVGGSDEPVRVVSVQPSPEVVQTNL